VFGVVVRGIGIYFIAAGLEQGLLGVARAAGIDLGPNSTVTRDLIYLGINCLVGLAFLASAKEIASAAFKGDDSDPA
jgi:hypothetical protein